MQCRHAVATAVIPLLFSSFVHPISTARVANVFDTSEEIVATIAQSSGTVSYAIDYGTYFNEVITGSATVVNNTVRIPAYFLTCGVATITVNGESVAGAIVPGVIRYSDHRSSGVARLATHERRIALQQPRRARLPLSAAGVRRHQPGRPALHRSAVGDVPQLPACHGRRGIVLPGEGRLAVNV